MRFPYVHPVLTAVTLLPGVCAAVAQPAVQSAGAQELTSRVVEFEQRANAGQPPDKVMDAIGVKPGMVIGELGAGRGRYTVHLARRVGPTGKVYANDIDAGALAFLRERCEREKITNIETILGKVDDPLFPKAGLDMVFMVWVYHMLESPAALLKNIVPGLKPGATIVMVEPVPAEIEAEISEVTARTKKKPDDIRVVTRASVEADAGQAGLELAKVMEGFLAKDNIFVLRKK